MLRGAGFSLLCRQSCRHLVFEKAASRDATLSAAKLRVAPVQEIDLGRLYPQLSKQSRHLAAMIALVMEQVLDHAVQRIGPLLPSGVDDGHRALERFLAQTGHVVSHLALYRLPALRQNSQRRELLGHQQGSRRLPPPAFQPQPLDGEQMGERVAQGRETVPQRTQELLLGEARAGLKLAVARPIVVIE